MPLVNTYTTLGDVRRVLRATAPLGRIRFSDSYSVLKKVVDNSGTVELLNIGIHNAYADVASYNIIFGSDSSSFTMYKNDTEKHTNFIVGTGNKQNDFTTNDGYFSIDSTSWIGYVFPGDTIEFMTDSHMSLIDASCFIQDAEMFVDSVVEENIRFSSVSESSLRFPLDSTSEVPKAIRLAASRIGAYFIYKSVFLEQHNEDKDQYSMVWLKEGLSEISRYVAKWNRSLSTSAPAIGHWGSNVPVDLDNDVVFKSDIFNLMIPINERYFIGNDYSLRQKAYNYLNSKNYLESVTADISNLGE